MQARQNAANMAGGPLDLHVMRGLRAMLHACNPFVATLRAVATAATPNLVMTIDQTGDSLRALHIINCKCNVDNFFLPTITKKMLSIMFNSSGVVGSRTLNAPTGDEVAAVIPGGDALPQREIIVHQIDGGVRRIDNLNAAFMALTFVLLFPRGEPGACLCHYFITYSLLYIRYICVDAPSQDGTLAFPKPGNLTLPVLRYPLAIMMKKMRKRMLLEMRQQMVVAEWLHWCNTVPFGSLCAIPNYMAAITYSWQVRVDV